MYLLLVLLLRPLPPTLSADQELDKNPEGKLLTCMDMKGARLSMFAGEVKVLFCLLSGVVAVGAAVCSGSIPRRVTVATLSLLRCMRRLSLCRFGVINYRFSSMNVHWKGDYGDLSLK